MDVNRSLVSYVHKKVFTSCVCSFLGFYFWWIFKGSSIIMFLNIIWHPDRLNWHFNLNKFRPNEVKRVQISLACVFAFMLIGWPLIINKAGMMGWIKFWLMPWLGYHFWVLLLPDLLCSFFIAVLAFLSPNVVIIKFNIICNLNTASGSCTDYSEDRKDVSFISGGSSYCKYLVITV